MSENIPSYTIKKCGGFSPAGEEFLKKITANIPHYKDVKCDVCKIMVKQNYISQHRNTKKHKEMCKKNISNDTFKEVSNIHSDIQIQLEASRDRLTARLKKLDELKRDIEKEQNEIDVLIIHINEQEQIADFLSKKYIEKYSN